jgi:multiple sugar transport system permease protein
VATQLTLLLGTVVFGLPFLFLLVTSFKEDRDLVSKDGSIIWVPRVTDVVKYTPTDPAKKHYRVDYDERNVEAVVIGEAEGKLQMDIFRPIGMRGITFFADRSALKETTIDAKIYTATVDGKQVTGFEIDNTADGAKILKLTEPAELKNKEMTFKSSDLEPVRHIGLRTENYVEALEYLPAETNNGLVYLRNTLTLVILNVIGTLFASSLVAYAFARMSFPGKDKLFTILLATMALPGAITMLPQFLIFRKLGWIDTLYPLWVPAFFGSAFNIFMLRSFFSQIPSELEDAAKIDGCTYVRTFWGVMLPQVKPALAVIAIWTFMGTWNNFQGPLIYINSPENMPLSYALGLFKGDRINEPGLLMAFSALTVLPVIALFFFTQRYLVENVSMSGLGGR